MPDTHGHSLVPAGRGDTIRILLLGTGQPLRGELVAISAVDADAPPLALVIGEPGGRARTVVPWHAISTMRRDNPGDQEDPF